MEKEDTGNEIARKIRILMTEINGIKNDVENTSDDELGQSIIKDFLDQLGDLKKRLSSIQSLDDKPIATPPIETREVGEDGIEILSTVTVDEFLSSTKRTLLKLKDDKQELKRREENREKILLQETLKSIQRLKIISLKKGFSSLAVQVYSIKGPDDEYWSG